MPRTGSVQFLVSIEQRPAYSCTRVQYAGPHLDPTARERERERRTPSSPLRPAEINRTKPLRLYSRSYNCTGT